MYKFQKSKRILTVTVLCVIYLELTKKRNSLKWEKTKYTKLYFSFAQKKAVHNHKRPQNIYILIPNFTIVQILHYLSVCSIQMYHSMEYIIYEKKIHRCTHIHTYTFFFHISVYKIYKYSVSLLLFIIRYIYHFHQFHIISI